MSVRQAIKSESLGGRLQLLDPGELPPVQKQFYEHMDQTLVVWAGKSGFVGKMEEGQFIGPFNAFLYTPGVTDGFLKLLEAEGKSTTLDKRMREVVILSVGAVWKSEYELFAHSAVGRKVGIPEAAIQALASGNSPEELTANEVIAHRFARQLSAEHRVDEDLYRQAEQAFGREGLVDMTYLIGIHLLTCAILNAFDVPVPQNTQAA
jgi:4-carboxymuconolactone decarboxylase